MPSTCAADITSFRNGSSPSVSSPRSQLGCTDTSASGPNSPVTISRRPSAPSTWPQTLASFGSKLDPIASGSGVAVVRFLFGELRMFTPTASAQHSGAMLGLVPTGAPTAPTAWQVGLAPAGPRPPWKRRAAFVSSGRVGGLVGSSWWMRLRTSGVYGARRSIDGELARRGSGAGSLYGTGAAGADSTAPARAATAAASAIPAPARPRWCRRSPLSPTFTHSRLWRGDYAGGKPTPLRVRR